MTLDSRRYAVVIASCDKSKDLWKPLVESYDRFWPDCPMRKYLITNHARPKIDGVEVVTVGEDRGWSAGLKTAIGRLKEEYVLLYVDDLFLIKQVDTHRLAEVLGWVEQHRPECVRLNSISDNYPVASMPRRTDGRLCGEIAPGSDYRVSTVLSLWKRQTLIEIVREGESAWEFEIHGSLRSDRYAGFYGTFENIFHVANAVIRGKWRPSAVAKLRQCGLHVDTGSRPVMGRRDIAYWYMKERISKIFSLLSPRTRRRIRLLVNAARQA
jgi:hypothetical protein